MHIGLKNGQMWPSCLFPWAEANYFEGLFKTTQSFPLFFHKWEFFIEIKMITYKVNNTLQQNTTYINKLTSTYFLYKSTRQKSLTLKFFLSHIYFQKKAGYHDELISSLSCWALSTKSNRPTQKLVANFATRLHTRKNKGCTWFSNSLGFMFNLSITKHTHTCNIRKEIKVVLPKMTNAWIF